MKGVYNNSQEYILDEAHKFLYAIESDKDLTGLFTRKDAERLAHWFWSMKMETAKIDALY